MLVIMAVTVLTTSCTTPKSYVGEDLAGGSPPPPKIKQDPHFAKETLEAQKRLWWPGS
jgi:hypothetical protein